MAAHYMVVESVILKWQGDIRAGHFSQIIITETVEMQKTQFLSREESNGSRGKNDYGQIQTPMC